MVEGIREKSVFNGFGRRSARASSGHLTLVLNDDEVGPPLRVAFAIPRRVGPAVVRNRLRRQLRAAFDEMARSGSAPDGAFLVIVRPAARGASYAQLVEWLGLAMGRLRPKIDPPGPSIIGDNDER